MRWGKYKFNNLLEYLNIKEKKLKHEHINNNEKTERILILSCQNCVNEM